MVNLFKHGGFVSLPLWCRLPLEPTNQTCQGKNLKSKTISFFYHPQPTSSFLVGLLVCWLVGSAVCQILTSVLTWGRLFVGFGPVRTHRALTDVRCPAHLASPEANTASASVSAHGHQLQPWCLHISILWFWSELFVCLLWHNHLLINTVDCNYVSIRHTTPTHSISIQVLFLFMYLLFVSQGSGKKLILLMRKNAFNCKKVTVKAF